jgi:hypothetical protein
VSSLKSNMSWHWNSDASKAAALLHLLRTDTFLEDMTRNADRYSYSIKDESNAFVFEGLSKAPKSKRALELRHRHDSMATQARDQHADVPAATWLTCGGEAAGNVRPDVRIHLIELGDSYALPIVLGSRYNPFLHPRKMFGYQANLVVPSS